jgi:molecular chaperone DnaK
VVNFLGIDLGTTFSAMATIDETGRPKIIHNSAGHNVTPSCVLIEEDGKTIVGETAEKQWGLDPKTAFARFKRDMGSINNHSVNGVEYTPTLLSSIVLRKLRQDAEKVLGSVDEAVVTIPANFAHEARDATMTAAKEAGLNVKYIINEPTAAAIYYAFKSGEELSGNYAVYDLGGGTFDVSVIRVDGHDVEVLSSNGISRLGGDDFDLRLQELVNKKFVDLTGEELEPEDFTKGDAEEEKKSLSQRDTVKVRVARKIIDISRHDFEEAISSLVTQAEMLCESTMDEAGVGSKDLAGVFLVGGSTRIPIVKASVERVFGTKPMDSVNVDEVVALGAALYAAFKADKSKMTSIQKQSIEKIKVSESTGKCFGTISMGFDTARNEPKLENSIIIRKGEKIPCSVMESFYTMGEGQDAVNCTVTESTAPENDPRFVKIIWEGELELPGGRPEGQEIKVTFAYDDNQIMKVSFLDVDTGRETKKDLSFVDSAGAGANEIDKFMVE